MTDRYKSQSKENMRQDVQPEREKQPTQTADQAEQEAAKAMAQKAKKKKRRRKAAIGLLIRFLVTILVIYVLFFHLVGVTVMPNGDMYPRVDAGDLILYYRLDKDVKAQDIIVLKKDMEAVMETKTISGYGNKPSSAKAEGTQMFICRVVAVAGDTVEVTEDGNLLINRSAMVESNIFYRTYPYRGYTEYPLTLQEGECFVLADARQGGADSRFFGPVKIEEIQGTVITILRRNNL